MQLAVLAISTILAGLVSAQSLAGLPTCAYTCVENSIPSSCNLDPSCICSSSSFLTAISCCVAEACNATDQNSTLTYAHSICDPVGKGTNLPKSASCANSTVASSVSASLAAASAAAASGSSNATSTVSSHSSAASSASTSASAAAKSSSASSSATAAASSGGAAEQLIMQPGVGVGVLGAALLGMVAFL